MNVADDEEWAVPADWLSDTYGRVDVLVNNGTSTVPRPCSRSRSRSLPTNSDPRCGGVGTFTRVRG
jgi:hypothetical protein